VRRSVITSRHQALLFAQEEGKKAQAVFDRFLVNGRPATNAEYIQVKSQIEALHKEVALLQRQFDTIESQRESAGARRNSVREDALLAQEDANLDRQRQKNIEATRLLAKLFEIMSVEKAQETNRLLAAQSRVLIAEAELANSPTAEDYFANFSPVVTEKAVSDADGKFAFKYHRDKSHTIFATARREVSTKTEKYYWLLDAPTNAHTSQIFLSNNNMVFADPNGYFRLKPKQRP